MLVNFWVTCWRSDWLLEIDNFVTFDLSFWSNYTSISWMKVHTWFIAFTMKKLNVYCAYQKLVNQYHLLKSPQRNNQETVWWGLHFVLYMMRSDCDIIQNYKTLKHHFRKMNFLGKWLGTKPLKVYELREETIFSPKTSRWLLFIVFPLKLLCNEGNTIVTLIAL